MSYKGDIFSFLCVDFSLFRLSKIKENIFIYGFNEIAKIFLLRFAEKGIYVDGFLKKETHAKPDVKFLNKFIYCDEDIRGFSGECLIVDPFGELDSREYPQCEIRSFMKPAYNEVIIYGAGHQGGKCYDLLCRCGIKVVKFCDRDPSKYGTRYFGIDVVSLQELKSVFFDVPVIVALDASIAKDVANRLVVAQGLSEAIYTYDESMDVFGPFELFGWQEYKDLHISIYPSTILYLIGKQVVLYGNKRKNSYMYAALRSFDIEVIYGIDCEGYIGRFGEIEYKSPYDLLYLSDDDNAIVLVSRDGLDSARRFAADTGINRWIFMQYTHQALQHIEYFDPNLGYNNLNDVGYSVYIINDCCKSNAKKIGIVGGSTSDVTLYNEVSWPEQLVNIAKDKGYDITVYAGGTAGYIVSQELIKFIRDMGHLSLDILISYSGHNDAYYSSANPSCNRFVHPYQLCVTEKIADIYSRQSGTWMHPKVYLSEGVKNVGEHWMYCEALMHSICQGMGIKFYAFLQPALVTKNVKTNFEDTILEHTSASDRVEANKVQLIKDEIRKYSKRKWIKDFTGVFDDCSEKIYFDSAHLTSYGNYMLAKKIFNVIEKELA